MSEESCGVKVFVRFRPINKREEKEGDSGDSSLLFSGDDSVSISLKNKSSEFRFDKVFSGPNIRQVQFFFKKKNFF